MYVTIGNDNYTNIKSLSFAPDADLTGDSLPVNDFTVEIFTDDSIAIGGTAELYDDLDTLFASYSIVYAEQVANGIMRIRAESIIGALSKRNRDLEMYVNEPVTNILANLFLGFTNAYELDSSFSSATISGYCPPQTARERLQWICMVLGAYCKTSFNDKVQILPIDDTFSAYVPIERVYWRPEMVYKDYVTSITVRAYTYTAGAPEVTDEWISDGTSGNYYIQTYQDYTLTNSQAPSGAPENDVKITDVTIINPSNVSAILTRLAQYYFNRDEINASIINNGDVVPGDHCILYTDETTLKEGFVRTAVFSFGVQAKSAIKLIMTGSMEGGKLIVLRKYNDIQLARETYYFPVGYSYSFDNRFMDAFINDHRYTFRPTTKKTEGTTTSTTTTKTVNYAVALDYYDNVLHIVSVDEATGSTGEVEIS